MVKEDSGYLMVQKTIAIKPEIATLVKKIKQQFSPAKVVLFGSRARNDFMNYGGWDLMVISENFEGISFRDRMDKILSLIEKPIGQDVEAFCYTPKEVEKRRKEIGLEPIPLDTPINNNCL